MKNLIDEIERILCNHLDPTRLDIEDVTHKHVKHSGHVAGKKHIKIKIFSPKFEGKTPLDQQRMVMDLLKPLLKHQIHSLSLETFASEEA